MERLALLLMVLPTLDAVVLWADCLFLIGIVLKNLVLYPVCRIFFLQCKRKFKQNLSLRICVYCLYARTT